MAEEFFSHGHRVLAVKLAYDGTEFSGYAKQPNLRTVEGTLEDALRAVIRPPKFFRLSVAGRTDAGVHATAQFVSVTTNSGIDPEVAERSLSKLLPPDIAVSVSEAPLGFDARRSALSRRYRYKLLTSPRPDPLRSTRAWWVGTLSEGAETILHRAASLVVGTHDFSAFCKGATKTRSDNSNSGGEHGDAAGVGDEDHGTRERTGTMRKVIFAQWSRPRCRDDPCCADELWFEIEANAFCHQMVRRIVGAMVHWARAEESPRRPEAVSEYRWKPAPPHGLYLIGVRYPPGTGVE
ncbi:MAG: hypothetical protein C4317_06945 [Acidimicrobiia bacterium]